MNYYHYTSVESLLAIIESDKLLASNENKGDAVLGDGVYFTDLAPSHETAANIFKNNWAQPVHMVPNWKHKMEACIEISYHGTNMITSDDILPRKVYVYVGEDMKGLYQRIAGLHIDAEAWRSMPIQQRSLIKQKFPGKIHGLQFAQPAEIPSPQSSPTTYSTTQAIPSLDPSSTSGSLSTMNLAWGALGALGAMGVGLAGLKWALGSTPAKRTQTSPNK